MNKYEHLRTVCDTIRQHEVLDAALKAESVAEAAEQIGLVEREFYAHLQRLKKKYAERDGTPVAAPDGQVPEGYRIRGKSHQTRDEDGNVCWVKTERDKEQEAEELIRTIVDAMKDELPREPKVLAPKAKNNDLLNCYVITDYHFGMLAWGEETGADWDIQIAEDMLVKFFALAIEQSPAASECIFAQVGDFMHFDSFAPVTPTSGHILDADSRLQKIIRCVIRVTRKIINMLLKKYRRVHVKWCDANHDPASAAWMREFLPVLYEKEPRITIDTSPDTYYCFEWGKTALFFHHGHKRKVANVDSVFAAKFRDVFGRTEHAYAHTGHYHAIDKRETNLMVVEQHRTLAAADAYASKGGWVSGREANVITYHKEYGQVASHTVSSKLIEDSACSTKQRGKGNTAARMATQ